ncbi:hypothetical protein NHX12_012722 [Muraenolepis orangiensis]|uniref:DUF3715 domain-containing protein n=1 Tax=Muraenolepis orangiensis TaxID=630683 RepID=A0A9Q0DGP6_9TELE|nr:hypothetical protein NHX12_012722 [Muraenolepis orangiensis]
MALNPSAHGRKDGAAWLYQCLPPDSREFDDLQKILSSFYLDSSSRGTFSYFKAKLIHNELLEKEFIEKRREMKQEGRNEQELAESYCFLYPDKSKLQWVCEKGLSVGHSRITTLGNPAVGVYLSKYADLLQINPFELGFTGDMIIFKVMRGRLKHIYENMPKNAMDPTPKFDCHVSKNANKVTSLLSYRAFELTQQYFFEFAFEEIKARPRHLCPYAVLSFQYKGKESGSAPSTVHRFNTIPPEVRRGKCYLVWSGLLVNKGQELFPVGLRSSGRPYLPFKLPERLEVSQGMQLDQVKRKIPSVLFSWDTYTMSREVPKFGMSCSLFDVVNVKGKATSGSLAALVHKLERDRMVLVKPLYDRGFLFLLSSGQMVNNKEQQGRYEKSLQALFIFQESRVVVKYSSRLCEPEPLAVDAAPSDLPSVLPFFPALHYSLFKLRLQPGKDLSSGVERHSTEYLARLDCGAGRPFVLPDYKQNLDERTNIHPAPRTKPNMDGLLRNYVHNPASYVLPLSRARGMVEKTRTPPASALPPTPTPAPAEYSPDRPPPSERTAPDRPHQESGRRRASGSTHPNGGQSQQQRPLDAQSLRMSQDEYDKEKMKELLKLIQLHKKAVVKEPAKGHGEAKEDGSWDPLGLKRRLAGEDRAGGHKRQRSADPLSNGESSRGAPVEDLLEEGGQGYNLMAVMESMGYNPDPKGARGTAHGSSVAETQRLLKVLLATLNKAMSQGEAGGETSDHREASKQEGGSQVEPVPPRSNTPGSLRSHRPPRPTTLSPFSPGSPGERPHTSDHPAWSGPAPQETAPLFPEPMALADGRSELRVPPVADVKNVVAAAPRLSVMAEEPAHRPSISLDTILKQEVHSLTSDIRSLMRSQHIAYSSHQPPALKARCSWLPSSSFSDFVVSYVTPVAIQGHVEALSEKLEQLVPPTPSRVEPSSPPTVVTPQRTAPTTARSAAVGHGDKPAGAKDSPSTRRRAGLIGQLKPEVFSSLMEVFKDVTRNTVKFYIYASEEADESAVCREIKEYLISLGNRECSPQTFLENSSSLDKLLIIIQNEDIAAHVHKIPALVSLKKLSAVSFAGVDTLDDVKNHTYNELFVSGGFIVSDEFVLNPDLITTERLQALLHFLEDQSSPEQPWQWKIHCKLNTNAMALLNLLTAYQKKHLVEFLPYHECDAQSRQAPDLDCMIKLQAQHTQQRHLIFLTERPFEMFLQYSRNGIVIASIDDIMSGFHSLIGSINRNDLPTPPSTVLPDSSEPHERSSCSPPVGAAPPLPPPPASEEFRPPLPEQRASSSEGGGPNLSDYGLLKTALSRFKVSDLAAGPVGGRSPGGFTVNPHQSFLCPSASWAGFPRSSGYSASPGYPGSPCAGPASVAPQDPGYRPPGPASVGVPAPPPPTLLTNLASLPLEVRPPPPPHLMVLGHMYGSDAGGPPFNNNNGNNNHAAAPPPPEAQPSAAPPGDRTPSGPSGPSEAPWAAAGEAGPAGGTSLNRADGPGKSAGVPPATGSAAVRPKMAARGRVYGGHADHGPARGASIGGGFRGRGAPPRGPRGPWPPPGRGGMRGGGPCSWGYPPGRGRGQEYYTDYTYTHH